MTEHEEQRQAAEPEEAPVQAEAQVKEPVEEYDDGAYRAYCDNNGFTYTCDVPDLQPGESRSFEFTAEFGAPGEGVLTLLEKDPVSPWDVGRRDPDPSNDKATIRVLP